MQASILMLPEYGGPELVQTKNDTAAAKHCFALLGCGFVEEMDSVVVFGQPK